ncbi:MAG: type IV pilus biogenesis protein PilM [Vulcanibacillus sp.]
MRKRQLAIVFDNYSVRFVEAKVKGNSIKTVYNTFVINNSKLIQDGILDKNEWNNLFKEVVDKKIFKTKIVHVIIPTSLVILRQQAMPDLPIEQLKKIIENEIGNTIHFPFVEPVFDIVKIDSEEPFVNDQGETLRQNIIVATPGIIINNILEVLSDYKFKLKSVDIPALSYYRYAKVFFPSLKQETKLFCYITNNGIDLHIIDNDILYFTRHIPNALQNYLNEEGVGFNDKEFAVDLASEIERAKNYFNYTLNKRERQITGVVLSSEREINDTFREILRSRISLEVTVLGSLDKTLPRKVKQFKGYELGIGAFFREVN